MVTPEISRRQLFIQSGAALTGLAFLTYPWLVRAFPNRPDEEIIPWLDQPPTNPKPEVVGNLRQWEELDSWLTPNDSNILCYEMNGEPLPQMSGFPLRLIAPGWYGIANVKWLKRIEVRETRYMGRFMARDYSPVSG